MQLEASARLAATKFCLIALTRELVPGGPIVSVHVPRDRKRADPAAIVSG